MFQRFLQASSDKLFRTRSGSRDADNDRSRIASIARSIEHALEAAEIERAGLSRRVADVLARAAITSGNESDEYLSREPLDSQHQSLFTAEILNGERRLEELAATIEGLKFIQAALQSKFPDSKERV